jgi:hypothetical protein
LIEDRADSKGKVKLAVRKMHNLRTGHSSGFTLEFSATGWNQTTLDYFDSVKDLKEARFDEIFNAAKVLAGPRGKPRLGVDLRRPGGKSSRSNLQSDDESDTQGRKIKVLPSKSE